MNLKCKFTKSAIGDEHFVFGWASVSADKAGNVIVDADGDTIAIEELEKAVYRYVAYGGVGDEMHEGKYVASLIESVVFTPAKMAAIGIREGLIPYGWFVGFRVRDESVWQKIKDGEYVMFSLGGKAERSESNE